MPCQSARNGISEPLHVQNFLGGMPPDPPRGSCLQHSICLPSTISSQPSTLKLNENPAIWLSQRACLRFCDHVRTHVYGECCQQFNPCSNTFSGFLLDWNEREWMVIHQGNLTSDYQIFFFLFTFGNNFPERWGVLAEIPSVVGVWIFSGTTQCIFTGVRPFLFDHR